MPVIWTFDPLDLTTHPNIEDANSLCVSVVLSEPSEAVLGMVDRASDTISQRALLHSRL